MPDISMCVDVKCPSRNDCYRYMATPTQPMQTYAGFQHEPDSKCDEYWPAEGRRDLRSVAEADRINGKGNAHE